MEQEQQFDSAGGMEVQEQQGQQEAEVETDQQTDSLAVEPADLRSAEEPEAETQQEPATEEVPKSEEQQEQQTEGEGEAEKTPEVESQPGAQPGEEKSLKEEEDEGEKEPEAVPSEPVAVAEAPSEPVAPPVVVMPTELVADKTPEAQNEAVAELEKQEEPKEEEKLAEEPVSESAEAQSVEEGSLSFAFLEQEAAVAFVRSSQMLFILRGLPGSGKSRLASAISSKYEGVCTVITADSHGVRPEKQAASAEGFKAIDSAVVECCTSGKAVVVVDDTNHTYSRLARLGELADEHQYLSLYLEPRTKWSRDVEQLSKKSHRGLSKSQIQALLGPMVESSLPLFFGWFLSCASKEQLKSMAANFLKSLSNLDAFKEHISDFSGEGGKAVDLEQHFSDKGMLHCTTMFCDYGRAQGAKEYAEKQAVRESYSCVTDLSLTALFITPRTAGAQVTLSKEQLQLWPENAEKEVAPDIELPPGSRAHITLGCAEGVEPVQTGVDLLQIVQLQQQGEKGEQVSVLELGPLTYYGSGMWMLSLSKPLQAPACFSSWYGPKKGDDGKEPEKKKKLKCAVM